MAFRRSYLHQDRPTSRQIVDATTQTLPLRTQASIYIERPRTHRRTSHAIILFPDPDCPSSHSLQERSINYFPYICPGLREIFLDNVWASEEGYDKYPDGRCSGREPPTPECLDYYNSESLVKKMITPLPRFHTTVVLWSKLRVLTLSPHEDEEMASLQPILDAACNTLEELYLTNIQAISSDRKQLSLAGLVNLRDLSFLHVFALYTIIKCDAQKSVVLRDINLVLSTIPTPNTVTNLSFDFYIHGKYPFSGCLEEDWIGLCDEVVRISGGKHLKMSLEMSAHPTSFRYIPLGQDELYERIMERITSLSDYPNICTHFWHPPRSRFSNLHTVLVVRKARQIDEST